MHGKRVIVTGAGGAIGSAIARRLQASNWHVIGLDLKFRAEHGLDVAIELDLRDLDRLRAVIAETARGEPIAGLVNCAGISLVGPFGDQEDTAWRALIEVNLMAPIVACHAVLPGMIAAGGGQIVGITSDSARVGAAKEAVYSASKGGLAAFSRSLAQEVGRHGVTVNCVSPGPVATPMSAVNPGLVERLSRRTPLQRVAQPEDIAGTVAFLLNGDADFVTGQTFSVSGGLTMAA